MSEDKNLAEQEEVELEQEAVPVETEEAYEAPRSSKAKEPKGSKKEKKPNIFVRMGKAIARKTKEVISELKKVTWPTFPKVVKQTGVVLAVVMFFLVIIFLFDLGLSQLLDLLTKSAS